MQIAIDGVMQDWIRHGTRLREDLLAASDWLVLHGRMTPGEQRALVDEVAIRRRIAARLGGLELVNWGPVDQIWFDFVIGHAQCQISRRVGDYGDDVFFDMCAVLRKQRDLRLKQVKGLIDERKRQQERHGWRSH